MHPEVHLILALYAPRGAYNTGTICTRYFFHTFGLRDMTYDNNQELFDNAYDSLCE